VITTPSGSHASISLAALAAGAHVLIEKPLTLSLEQADEILEASRKSNRKVAVGHIYRFFPLVQTIRADILSGHLAGCFMGMSKFAGVMARNIMTRQPGAGLGPGWWRPDEPECPCYGSDDLASGPDC